MLKERRADTQKSKFLLLSYSLSAMYVYRVCGDYVNPSVFSLVTSFFAQIFHFFIQNHTWNSNLHPPRILQKDHLTTSRRTHELFPNGFPLCFLPQFFEIPPPYPPMP